VYTPVHYAFYMVRISCKLTYVGLTSFKKVYRVRVTGKNILHRYSAFGFRFVVRNVAYMLLGKVLYYNTVRTGISMTPACLYMTR
jgi:hypothetical protein